MNMKSKEEQVIQIKECIDAVYGAACEYYDIDGFAIADEIYEAGFRKQSEKTIELPFKVGDTVYVPWCWHFQQCVAIVEVEEIKFYDSQMHYMFLIDMESDDECFNQSFGGWKIDQCVGETVFLTKDEAEMKMRGGAE